MHDTVFGLLFVLGIPLCHSYEIITLIMASVTYYISNITMSYVSKLLLRNLIFRLAVFVVGSILLFNGYITAQVLDIILVVLLLSYYLYIIISRPSSVPLIYTIASLSLTLSIIAIVT